MRDKIIKGDFEDPEWLSLGEIRRISFGRGQVTHPCPVEARDLITNILQKDPTARLTIPKILAHPWFTSRNPSYQPASPTTTVLPPVLEATRSSSPDHLLNSGQQIDVPESVSSSEPSTLSATSDTTFLSASSEFDTSAPTTPDDRSLVSDDPFNLSKPTDVIHRNPSDATLKNKVEHAEMDARSNGRRPETVIEEDHNHDQDRTLEAPPVQLFRSNSTATTSSSKAPPALPTRTPVRTKRRSVSSIMSDAGSPTEKNFSALPVLSQDLDFASLLSTPAPIIFSTPLERNLLNSLSSLGFDTGQIVHSVLSDACDAAGAVWWMLKRKSEKKALEEGTHSTSASQSTTADKDTAKKHDRVAELQSDAEGSHPHSLNQARSAPQLAFVPPTPTAPRAPSPPQPKTPTRSPMLSASSTTESLSRSHPTTPAGSVRDKDRDGSKGRKARSGSVSIMQRATTALEAAGLVRKKSSEAVREDKEKDREREREKEREKSREGDRKVQSGEESRSSHGSGSSKLAKSPAPKTSKDHSTPSTPPPNELHHPQPQIGSPWVLTGARDALPQHMHATAPTPANSPGDMLPLSDDSHSGKSGPHRNRANLLTAFRLWFNEDRKGKRKETEIDSSASRSLSYTRPVMTPVQSSANNPGTGKRRPSTSSAGRFTPRAGRRGQGSSRRSSSVNSKRSSGTSVQMILLDSPLHEQIATRRSFGAHTPNSERGEYSSRPSSIRSFSMQRHRKSPSASSAGSTHFRTASPMQKYHKRGPSGSSGSSTRVIRQTQTTPSTRPPHVRSNSATSSIMHSPSSSRPASFYEFSENEGPRNSSPFKPRSRRSADEVSRRTTHSSNSSTTFVAQKRQGPFMSPLNHGGSMGRSSWKKAWGMEPPGWQTRTAHVPIEVLAISPATEPTSLRDVFSGRQSISLGDESDWVDEDDDIPLFAGGLGQMPTSVSLSGLSSSISAHHGLETSITLAPAPRGNRPSKRVTRNAGSTSIGMSSSSSSRQKASHTPAERVSPIPMDARDDSRARRQLPPGRSGPAFRHPIQEEDEGEEE